MVDGRPSSSRSSSDAPGDEPSGDRVIRAIQRFSRSPARAELARTLYQAGGKELTPTQVDALETLASRTEWHMHEFAKALDINAGAASRTTDRLIKLGLAARRPDESDRRYVVVHATTAGRRISGRIQRDRHALMLEVMAGLTDDQRTSLADMLEYVTQTMETAIARRAAPHPARKSGSSDTE